MKFSELLKDPNKYAYVLGMIYAWVMIDKKKEYIVAYSSYKQGRRNKVLLDSKSMEEYVNEHKLQLKKYLKLYSNIKEDIIYTNSEIKKTLKLNFFKNFGSVGVSILIEIDEDIKDKIANIKYNHSIYFMSLIEEKLLFLNNESKNEFIRSFIENRASFDWSSLFAIDGDQKNFPELNERKVNVLYNLMGAIFNFNPRTVQPNSNEKNAQIRVRIINFAHQYGFLIPFKKDLYQLYAKYKDFDANLTSIDNITYKDMSHSGKLLDRNLLKVENININKFHIEICKKDLTEKEREKLISEYRLENGFEFDSDDEILYSNQNMKFKAKELAKFKCEMDPSHLTFLTKKDGKPYVEGHHLIPFSVRNNFQNNIDIVQNIVSLCPNCHRKIHFAKENEVLPMLEILFKNRKEKLESQGIEISLKSLASFYKINTSDRNLIDSLISENNLNLTLTETPKKLKKSK